jgi:hypothetical protein
LLTLKKYESAKQQVPVFALHSVYWLLFCVLRAAVFTAVAAFDAGGLSYFEAYIMCCLPSSFIRKLLRFVVMLLAECHRPAGPRRLWLDICRKPRYLLCNTLACTGIIYCRDALVALTI